MAKIPGIRYTSGVASLGRDDPYRPSRVAQAASKAFLMTNAAAKDLANLYQKHVNELDIDKAHTNTNEEVNNWEQGMLEQFKEGFEYSKFLVIFFKSILILFLYTPLSLQFSL